MRPVLSLRRRPQGGWRRRPTGEPAAPEEQVRAAGEAALLAQWTGGAWWSTRALSALVWAAVLAGPVGVVLAGAAVTHRPAVAAPPAAVSGPDVGETAAVGEFAQRLVVLWLTSVVGQEARLAPLLAGGSDAMVLPQVGWRAEAPATAGLRRTSSGVWSVTVGVTVRPPTGAAVGERRFFQVPVRYTSGAVVALLPPAPVAAPPAAGQLPLAYRYPLGSDSPPAAAARGFLTALLTGSGDVTRYVSPGSSIPPVLPVPYRSVTVTSVLADRDLSGQTGPPAGGDRLRVLVAATAAASPRQAVGVSYALTLTARAGRWEITAIDPVPDLDPTAPPAASPLPSDSSSPTNAIPEGDQ